MIKHKQELATLRSLLHRYPIVGIVGARQVGKTTLARLLVAQRIFFSQERLAK